MLTTLNGARFITVLLALLVATMLVVPQAHAKSDPKAAPLPDPDASLTLNLSDFAAGTSDDLIFTFTPQAGVLNSVLSTLTITIPAGWTQPQLPPSTAAGFLSLTNSGCQSGPTLGAVTGSLATGWTIGLTAQCGLTDSFTLTYNNPVAPSLGSDTTLAQSFGATLDGAGGALDLLFGAGSSVGTATLQPVATTVTAVAGDGVVDLSWTTVSEPLTGFSVQRSDDAGVSWTTLTSTPLAQTTLTYSDTAVTNGTTYAYRVVTLNPIGQAFSAAVNATPQLPVPGAPDLGVPVEGIDEVDLSWTAPTTGGTVATYTVQRATGSTPAEEDFAALPSASGLTALLFNDTTAVRNTTYTYRVLAVNASGSTPSNTRQATPLAPDLDCTPGFDCPGDGECTEGLDCPGDGDCTEGLDCPGDDDCTEGLDCPGDDDCTLGVDCPGDGECTVNCPPAAPGAPTLVNALGGDAKVDLVWTAPATGGAVASYTVRRAEVGAGGAGAYADIATTLVPTTLTLTDTGVTNGTTYSYVVVATNATGSATSTALQATPLAPIVNNGGIQTGGGGGGSVPTPQPTTAPAPGARCVAGKVPSAGFRDVAEGAVHEGSIDCIAWHRVTKGISTYRYGPDAGTTRGQMASFLDRAIKAAGIELPAGRDRYRDDNGSVHEAAINRLAAAGIVTGIGRGRFGPNQPVRRDQLATMLVRTYAYLTDRNLTATKDHFVDDKGNLHEVYINIAADLGLALGLTDVEFGPKPPLRRDQMATFISRLLELLAGENKLNTPQ